MTIEVKVPVLPESVTDGVVVAWHKQPGDAIRRDEALVDIETDKVVLEIPAPDDGVLEKILFNNGDTVTSAEVLGLISTNGTGKPAQPKAPAAAKPQPAPAAAKPQA
ncbi:MAG: biotin/lipoyl-containing protein, partial [Gammaproteobacteria bacterium]